MYIFNSSRTMNLFPCCLPSEFFNWVSTTCWLMFLYSIICTFSSWLIWHVSFPFFSVILKIILSSNVCYLFGACFIKSMFATASVVPSHEMNLLHFFKQPLLSFWSCGSFSFHDNMIFFLFCTPQSIYLSLFNPTISHGNVVCFHNLACFNFSINSTVFGCVSA